MLPDGWKSVPLAEICSSPISYGIVQTGEHVPDGIPCLRVIDIAKKEIDLDKCIRTNEIINSQYKRTLLKEGDIVLALRGEIGLAKIIDQRHSGVNITRGLAKISSDRKKVAPHFLFQALRAPSLKAELDRRSGGSALQEISLGELRKASILLPPLPEQKKIAAILSTWDRAIEGTEKLLANSQQQKKALMQQLLTGKKRLSGFTGEWRNIALAACCKPQQWATISSKDLTFSGFPVYGANGFIGYFSEYNHQNDTVTVTCRGSTCGTVSLIKGPSYITGNSMCLDQVKKDCSHIYLYYYLNHRGLKDIISGSAQPQIVGKAIQKVSVRLPSFPEQKAIAAVLTTADEEITALESDLSRLRQEKKALMQQLLTGKRRVKVD